MAAGHPGSQLGGEPVLRLHSNPLENITTAMGSWFADCEAGMSAREQSRASRFAWPQAVIAVSYLRHGPEGEGRGGRVSRIREGEEVKAGSVVHAEARALECRSPEAGG